MREIGAFEAKNKLGALLDAVARGEEVIITRRGKAVARLVRADDEGDQQHRGRAAVERVRALRQGVTLGEGVTLKDLIDEGRR